MTDSVNTFIHGALAMACLVAGIRFLAFYRLSRDRFFLWFAAAFWAFMVGWVVKLFIPDYTDHTHYLYLFRLSGFVLILIAIWRKNRQSPG